MATTVQRITFIMHVSEGGVSAHGHRTAESLLKGLSFSSEGVSIIK